MNETKALEITLNKLNEIIEYQAKRIRQLEAQLVGCENSLNKTNNAFKELEEKCKKCVYLEADKEIINGHIEKEIALEKRIIELESALHKIDNWAKAYPIKAFPEPDLKKAAKVLKAAGLTLDAISASNMRHVINRVKGIVEVALKGGPYEQQAVTKMPKSCTVYPCTRTPQEAKLEKDENGFMVCPLCKRFYGKP